MKKSLISMTLSALMLAGTLSAVTVAPAAEAAEDNSVIIGVTSMTGALDPLSDSWDLTSEGLSETLYMQDEEGNLVSRYVKTLEQKDDRNWEMTLNEGLKFSDGSDINAQAVADCYNTVMEKVENARASAGKIQFNPTGDYTLELTTEKPTKLMSSVLCEWTNALWKQADDGSYIFSGPYVCKDFQANTSMKLEPNEYYDDQVSQRPDVTIMLFQDTAAMQQAFEGGEIDMAFTVTPQIAEQLQGEGYTVNTFDAGYQYFSVVNLQKAPLDDANVRKALSLAVNRENMVTALDGGQVANGAFAHYYSFAGDIKVEEDADQAGKLLDEAGWKLNDSGVREKDGQPLSIELATYPSRPDLSVLMQLMASDYTDLGITVTTKMVDNIGDYASEGNYDILLWAQHTAPSGEPGYFLNQFFGKDGGNNKNGYASDDMESVLEKMGTLEPGDERDLLARHAQEIIYQDLPIIYLVDPQWHIAVSDKLAGYKPYCGDYYIVNAKLGLN